MTPTLTGAPDACFGAPRRSVAEEPELEPESAAVVLVDELLASFEPLSLPPQAATSTTAATTATVARRHPDGPPARMNLWPTIIVPLGARNVPME
jgi:hypothetical protein